MKYKILFFVLCVSMFLIFPANAETTTPEKLTAFLASNDVNWNHTNGTLSSVLAREMVYDAYDDGINMGSVKFINRKSRVGYFFCYYIDKDNGGSSGKIMYIDPETDAVYNTHADAMKRLSSGVHLPITRSTCYPPYTDIIGVGFFGVKP